MRLFLILTVLFTLGSVIAAWIWNRYQGRSASMPEMIDRYWYRFLLGGMTVSLIVVGLEGGYLI